jgi:zinc protease
MLETAVRGAHEFFLDNGLKVVFVPQGAAPVATFLVVYRVGARNEAVGWTGSSHLLEHMLFKGTHENNRRRGRAFADMMNEIGANKNATTWIDRTNYFETVPSGYLEFAIELEADRMRGALIEDADRRSEMTVVRNELERNDNNPLRVLSSAVVSTAFREHPYHHPTIGWRADVESVSTARLRELYDTYYHPDNATAFVVGDFDESRTREAIERTFGALPRAARPVPEVYTDEPPQAGERTVTVKRPGDTSIVAFAFHAPAALGQTHVLSNSALARRIATGDGADANDDYALEVLAHILGHGRTSRLSRALVDTGLALAASAWNWGSRDPGLFQAVVNVTPGVAAVKARDALDEVLRDLARDVPALAEVERAQNQIVVQRAFARDGTLALAQRLGEFEAVGSWRIDEDYVERIRAVTPERVRDVVRAYLHEDNRTVGILLPETPKTRDSVPFEAVEERTERDDRIEAAPLPLPRTGRVARLAERIAGGSLTNGARWRFVTSAENPTAYVRGIIEAGPALAPAHPTLAGLVAAMLSRGTRRRGRHAIEEALEGAGMRRVYHVDDERSHGYNALAFRFSAACVASDLPQLLETIAEELREPAFDPDEFALIKSELAGSLRLAKSATGWRATQRFMQLAYEAGDPNDVPGVDDLLADLDGLTLDDARDFHARVFLRAPAFVSGAGSVGEDAFARLLERTLGSVPLDPGPRPLPVVRPRPARDVREDVALERKASVDIDIGRATNLVHAAPDYLAALVANGILGQSTLSSRLGLRLRDREGLTYGVTSAFLSPARAPGPWRITVSVNPANVDRAVASARDVLREYGEDGPRERELIAQRNSMAGQHSVRLATNSGIATELERISYYELDDDFIDAYRERLAAVEHDDVLAAIRTYFSERDLIVAAAGTFAS